MHVWVILLEYVHRFLKCSRTTSPTIVSGMRFRESPQCAGQVALFTKVIVNMFHAEFEGPSFVLHLFNGEIPADFNFIQANGSVAPFRRKTEMNQIMRLNVDHVAANSINRA